MRKLLAMSEREYRANLDGLNVVFGAVLGFVLAAAESLSTLQYVVVLVASAAIVVSILYISAASQKLAYAIVAGITIAVLPRILHSLGTELPPKLQPTLATWAVIVALLEIMPRKAEPIADA